MTTNESNVAAISGRNWFNGRWNVIALLLLSGICFFVDRYGFAQEPASRQADKGERELPVATAQVERGDMGVYLSGLGSVQSPNSVTVTSQVSGQLTRIAFEEGQFVKQGDLLAVVDTRPYEAQLKQYEGQLLRDQALLRNAKTDLVRYRTLVEQDSGTQQQLDTQASLVKQYEGSVKVDEAQIESTRLQITYANITAPISGRLGLRLVDVGNIVQAGSTNGLVVIAQMQPINVVFTIPEDQLPQVLDGLNGGGALPVDAYDRSGKKKLASGVLLTVDNQIDPATGTIKLKAEFPNSDLALFPNQFVNARVRVALQKDATLIPDTAIQQGAQGTFVYVVQPDHTVSVRNVELGTTDKGKVVVSSGLEGGELVVTDGADKLREGAKVKLADQPPGAATDTASTSHDRHRQPSERSGIRQVAD